MDHQDSAISRQNSHLSAMIWVSLAPVVSASIATTTWLGRGCATVTHGKTPPASAKRAVPFGSERFAMSPQSENVSSEQDRGRFHCSPAWAAVLPPVMPEGGT